MPKKIIPPPNGLTDTFVKNQKPQDKPYNIPDKGCKGLRLSVSKAGAKAFTAMIYIEGKRKIFTLGHYPDLSLADARVKLGLMKSQAKNGTLVTDKIRKITKQKEKQAQEEQERVDSITVDDVLREFEKKVMSARRDPSVPLRTINSEIRGKGRTFKNKTLEKHPIAGMLIKDVELKHIEKMVMVVKDRGAPKQASGLFSVCKQFFRWARVNKYIKEDPIEGIKKEDWGIIQGEKGDYPLDIASRAEGGRAVAGLPEITKLFKALDADVNGKTRNVIKLLLLTGVRSRELLLAEKKHVNVEARTWYIPKENTKSFNIKKPEIDTSIIVPMSDYCLKLFQELMSWSTTEEVTELVYRKLPHTLNKIRVKHGFENYFTIHTLRKTMRSHIAGWASFEVCEKSLNHSLGKLAAVYDSGSMLEERRKALDIWSSKVYQACYGAESNIVQLRG